MAGTPVNSLNLNSTVAGLVNWDGVATPSTTALTQYYVVSGASATTVNNISPSTSTYVLTSNGISAQPTFQAVPYIPLTWTDEAISFAVASNNGYFVSAVATATLPPTPSQGDMVRIVSDTASVVTVTANTGQFIRVGKIVSAAAGTAKSNFLGDAIGLVYRASDLTWLAIDCVGTWTVT